MITDIVLGGHIFFSKFIHSFIQQIHLSVFGVKCLTVDIEQRTKHPRFLWSLNSCDWRETKNKQIITVISSGDKCYFRNKQDYVTRLGRGATLNRMKASLWR